MISSDYFIPAVRAVIELEINKSRFVAYADRAVNRSQALAHLHDVRKLHPAATHHCWAYLIGHPRSPVNVAFSDAGEPNGSAGKPILNVLNHNNIGDVMITVARYFGGVKLGAGGLIRSYSRATYLALQALETQTFMDLKTLTIAGSFELEQAVRHWFLTREGGVINVDYKQEVEISLEIRERDIRELRAFLLARNARVLDS
ncbi:MAG: IMPACT family protein [Agarilytica sp.]